MSYMDNKLAFAPAGAIQELSFDEIDSVAGGPFPLLGPAVAWLAANGGALIAAGTALAVAGIAYLGVTRTDDSTTYNYYDNKGRLVRSRTVRD